ncbi:hypothetical protein VMCG_03938 [Cytospora schulzeri]|uniref:alpha-1,2-Mannosidase n=1 Tax=Cytospora schulzeri TaxID=448051 RepID=A0A423WV30_9PEZI|nr:hypothetical protein VMCG_03938 [Valsa malicola]
MYPPSPGKTKKRPFLPRSAAGRTRLSRRNILLTFLGVTLVYFLYNSHQPEPESVRLARYMNADGRAHRVWDVKSSFDWGRIKPKYPPEQPPVPLPTGRVGLLPRVQHAFGAEPPAAAAVREARRDEVRKLFQKNWRSYRRFAWMQDALLPISGGGRDQFSGWAATLVDSLDVLWIMGLRDEFDEAVDAVAGIDFGKSTSNRVNMFETNIRYLGGLLAAYDLSERSVLLTKAVELGEMLYAGFNTENRMPVDFFDVQRSKSGKGLEVEGNVVSASPGSLLLEFTRLTQLTGDPKYYSAITKITELFLAGQNKTMLPGMWPILVSMKSEDVVTGNDFSLGSYADSLYEYTVKMYAMLGGREPAYKTMSKSWMETANEYLFFRPMLPHGEDILLAGNVKVLEGQKPKLDPESEHLSCFIGGIYALGGRLFNRKEYINTGAKLANGCAFAYRAMPTGMMPERYNTAACESRDECPWKGDRWVEERQKRPEWKEHLPLGFTTAKDPRYILRPEAIESIFVLYRVTGRQEFQETAWEMFKAVGNGTETEFANAAVMDVTRANFPLEKEDYMELPVKLILLQSFWLAETLKYYYLALSPPDLISLDEFVLNTEAHPFRRPK